MTENRTNPRRHPGSGDENTWADPARATVVRPLLVVLDDYNAFIHYRADGFEPILRIITPEVGGRYGYQPDAFGAAVLAEAVGEYCGLLNTLSRNFELVTPVMWTNGNRTPDYEQVAGVLPLETLDRRWPMVAAVVVDLQWMPLSGKAPSPDSGGWSSAGRLATHILSRRYPSLPCFLVTENWSMDAFQDALAHGAHWCFHRTRTPSLETEFQLSPEQIAHRLEAWADIRYTAFRDVPFPDQFRADPGDPQGAALVTKLVSGSGDPELATTSLPRMMATLFPGAGSVRPVIVMGDGRSAAQATFLASTDYGAYHGATRFIKIGPWCNIQREYHGCAQVIQPRMNSYVAVPVAPPVVTVSDTGAAPSGALASTLAGFPEDYSSLRSLYEWIAQVLEGAANSDQVADGIHATFERVLQPLYVPAGELSSLREERRGLWQWLGHVLPPLFTGELIGVPNRNDDRETLNSRNEVELPDETRRVLAACDLAAGGPGVAFTLRQFELFEVEWEATGAGECTLRHPELGFRIKLRAPARTIERHFGSLWLRPGMPVTVSARFDDGSRDIRALNDKIHTALKDMSIPDCEVALATACGGTTPSSRAPVEPLDLIRGESLLPAMVVAARMGPVHGDLNLHNIMFAGEHDVGWLIDFELAREDGMVAFDFAKLEVEIWQHFLFREVYELCRTGSGVGAGFPELLRVLAQSLERTDAGTAGLDELLSSCLGADAKVTLETGSVPGLFRIISAVRGFARDRLGLSPSEMCWALGAYFLASVKFTPADQPWRAMGGYLLAARCLTGVVPCPPDGASDWVRELSRPQPPPGWQRRADGVVLGSAVTGGAAGEPLTVDQLAVASGATTSAIPWPDSVRERWDMASTGGVANISPIMGYLWLRARAEDRREDSLYPMVVPKVSSRGKSCGTVDILETGGARFIDEPREIVDACRRNGGVLCRQDRALTPVDARLMERRRRVGAMKNAALTYASVLGKKIALGCTHAVVDVKVGADTKMLAPWWGMNAGRFTDVAVGGLLPPLSVTEHFMGLLESMGVEGLSVENDGWVRQRCSPALKPLREVRWVVTNGDMPQCRAIGRQLILLHLEQMLAANASALFPGDGLHAYNDWYGRGLAAACGVDAPTVDQMRRQWRLLVDQALPHLARFATREFFENPDLYISVSILEKVHHLHGPEDDLAIVAFPLAPYTPAGTHPVRIEGISAFAMDRLFAFIGGEQDYDPDVGIWLHRLPGELVRQPEDEPFISVFFRPSRTNPAALATRVRDLLRHRVSVAPV